MEEGERESENRIHDTSNVDGEARKGKDVFFLTASRKVYMPAETVVLAP